MTTSALLLVFLLASAAVLLRIGFVCWDSRYETRSPRSRLLFWMSVQVALFFGAAGIAALGQ
jgi:hypothetical protein